MQFWRRHFQHDGEVQIHGTRFRRIAKADIDRDRYFCAADLGNRSNAHAAIFYFFTNTVDACSGNVEIHPVLIVDGKDFAPLAEVQDEIGALWGDAGDRVREMLADEPGLELQPTPFHRRVSYYYQPDALRPETLRKIEQAGFDWLLSAETFLDVLPKGVAKGPTLLRTVAALGLPQDRVLVAGDTLNDLSLFETQLKGVAVGNSEPKLIDAIDGYDWVYRSPLPGAAGIADALRHFRMHPKAIEGEKIS